MVKEPRHEGYQFIWRERPAKSAPKIEFWGLKTVKGIHHDGHVQEVESRLYGKIY